MGVRDEVHVGERVRERARLARGGIGWQDPGDGRGLHTRQVIAKIGSSQPRTDGGQAIRAATASLGLKAWQRVGCRRSFLVTACDAGTQIAYGDRPAGVFE